MSFGVNFAALNARLKTDAPVIIHAGQVGALRIMSAFFWRMHTLCNRLAYSIERVERGLPPNRVPRLNNGRTGYG